jgi:hypothetical protein
MPDREHVSDERLRDILARTSSGVVASAFTELLDTRARIARALEALDYQHIEGACGVGYAYAVYEARAILTGDEQ